MAIPKDAVIREMSPEQLDELAAELTTDEEREALSDALLRIERAYRDGAHSEMSDTRRSRRIRAEVGFNEELGADSNPISEDKIQSIMIGLANGGLTKTQRSVWILIHVEGLTQEEAGLRLGIKQPAVSRALDRADAALVKHAKENATAYQMLQALVKRGYFRPGHRPDLPPELDEARRELEADENVDTCIVDPYAQQVEVWRGDAKPEIREGRRVADDKMGFRRMIGQMRRAKKGKGLHKR